MSAESSPGRSLADELRSTLASLAVRVDDRPDGELNVSAGKDLPTLRVDPNKILSVRQITTPWGAPAATLVHEPADWPAPATVMILNGDLAFAPAPDAAQDRVLGEGGLKYKVTDLPPVLGLSELQRLLQAGSTESSYDRLLGVVLAAAAGVEGARRSGIDVEALDTELDAAVNRVRSS